MKTYLMVWFNTDGPKTSEITERLLSMGFKAQRGNYDYMYDWGRKAAGLEETIKLGDQVHATLKGSNVLFKLESEE